MKKRSGYFLLETLLSISLIAILLSSTAYILPNTLDKSHIHLETQALYQHLQWQRFWAMSHDSDVLLTVENQLLTVKTEAKNHHHTLPKDWHIEISNKNRFGIKDSGNTQFPSTISLSNSNYTQKISIGSGVEKIKIQS